MRNVSSAHRTCQRLCRNVLHLAQQGVICSSLDFGFFMRSSSCGDAASSRVEPERAFQGDVTFDALWIVLVALQPSWKREHPRNGPLRPLFDWMIPRLQTGH